LLPNQNYRAVGSSGCDKLYLDLGGDQDSLKRQMLAGWHSLREDGSGHTWFPQGKVREAILKAVRKGIANPPQAIALGIRARWLAVHADNLVVEWVGEAKKAQNEQAIADKLHELRGAKSLWAAASTEIVQGLLTPHQHDRVGVALQGPVGILAGTPGTGKTFALAQIVKYLACRFGIDTIAVCAPTGKAAVRITSALLHCAIDRKAKTIHRTLGVGRNGHDGDGWGFKHTAANPLPYKFVIVDESSMIDTDLMAALMLACAPGTHVLLVGDPYQLPQLGMARHSAI